MLRNYLLVALRTLRRRRAFAFLNIAGLAVGIACCLLLARYVAHETSFDRSHPDADRTYRLVSDLQVGDGAVQYAASNGWPAGHLLRTRYPEVEALTYLRTWPSLPITHEGTRYYEEMMYADDAFFDVFGFPVVEGGGAGALDAPFEVVLSTDLRDRLFGDGPAVGETILMRDTLLFTVTGVVEVPEASHVQFDVLASFATVCGLGNGGTGDCETFSGGWGNVNVYNYLRLAEGTDADAFAARIRDLPAEEMGEGDFSMRLALEPLTSIYLHSSRTYALGGPAGNAAFVWLLGAVGAFILLLACINFINLTTARSAERAREVGIRKAVGSTRAALIGQFLGESVLLAVLALVLAVGLVSLALPGFNELAGTAFRLGDLFGGAALATAAALVVGVGVVAGLYPALVLSRPRPAVVLKGGPVPGGGGARLRQGLVVVQFAVSIALVAATLVVGLQLRYMQNQSLGFAGEQVLVVDARRAPGGLLRDRLEPFVERLEAHPAVARAATAGAVPGRDGWSGQHSYPDGTGDPISLEYVPIGPAYAEVLGLDFVAGRDLDADRALDVRNGVLINAAAAEAVGWTPETAVGRPFTSPGSGKPEGVVVGVLADYHHHGLQEAIGPMMFGVTRGALSYVALRLDAEDAGAAVAHVEAAWDELFTGYPMEHTFLDEDFARQYRREALLTRVFAVFAGLAVLIACLGLFGLAAFTAERRTKEIGVRKVLGASVAGLVGLLTREFAVLVGIAFVVAAPAAYFALDRWLDAFAYRLPLGPGAFIAAGLGALAVALLTVSYQALRAATTDPVHALRYE